MAKVNATHGTKIADYMSLWRWSTAPQTAPLFWLQLVEFLGIKFDRSPEMAFETKVRSAVIQRPCLQDQDSDSDSGIRKCHPCIRRLDSSQASR